MWLSRQKKHNADLKWSTSPGCFEKHLLRRLNNPLFPSASRTVTEQELRGAKTFDEKDDIQFKQAFEAHIREGRNLAGQRESPRYIADYMKRTLELMERASTIGGDHQNEIKVLEAALEGCREILDSHTGRVGAASLQHTIALHLLQIENPFLAQSFRPDSPFRATDVELWIAALLSEDGPTIERSSVFAGGMGIRDFVEQARRVLTRAVQDGLPPLEARHKLEVLEGGYAKGVALK